MKITNDSVENLKFNGSDVEILKFNGNIVWQKNTKFDWGSGSDAFSSDPDLFYRGAGLIFDATSFIYEREGITVYFKALEDGITYQYRQFVGGRVWNIGSEVSISKGETVSLTFNADKNIVNFLGVNNGNCFFVPSTDILDPHIICWPYGNMNYLAFDCFSGCPFITDTRYLWGSDEENLPDFNNCKNLKYINLTNYDLTKNYDFDSQFYNAGLNLDDQNIEHYILVKDKQNLDILNEHLSELIHAGSKYKTAIADVRP